MPTAFTVPAEASVNVPPLARYLAVPEPGTGVEPSVVYQIPVFPLGRAAVGPYPGSARLTVRGNDCTPEEGDMVGAKLVAAEQFCAVTFPVRVGV